MINYSPFDPCQNHLCDYWVPFGVAYCCYPCHHADDNKYEIHKHGERCSRRTSEDFGNTTPNPSPKYPVSEEVKRRYTKRTNGPYIQ